MAKLRTNGVFVQCVNSPKRERPTKEAEGVLEVRFENGCQRINISSDFRGDLHELAYSIAMGRKYTYSYNTLKPKRKREDA